MDKQQILNTRFFCVQLACRPDREPEQVVALAKAMEAYLLDGMVEAPAAPSAVEEIYAAIQSAEVAPPEPAPADATAAN
jgi:hypothetical protein